MAKVTNPTPPMKPYTNESSEPSSAASQSSTASQRTAPPERIKFTSQLPAVLLTSALVIGAGAWMLNHEATQRVADLAPLKAQNEALRAQSDDNRRQLESTSRLLKEALARHDGEVFRTEDEIQKLNDDRVGLLADAITKRVIPALPQTKTPEEAQRAEEAQVDKVATRLTENLTPLISRLSTEQAEQRKTSALMIQKQKDQIQVLDKNLQATQLAAQDTLRLTHEVSAMYLDSYKDHGVLMRLFSLPANLVIDTANLNLVYDRSKAKTQTDLNNKMSELEQRLQEVKQSPVALAGKS